MDCVNCNSSNTKKNGHTPMGNQRYLCRSCGKSFGDTLDPRRLTLAQREQALKLAQEGTSQRAIARLLDKGRKAVALFLKTRTPAPCSA